MKTLFKLFILSGLSILAAVACQKKSDGGGGSVAQCVVGQPTNNGTYCDANGQLVTAQVCNQYTVPPQGFSCVNGYLIPFNIPGGSGNLLSNVQFQNSFMQGVVNLSAAGGVNIDLNNPQAVYFYAGSVTLNGSLQVLNQSLCGAPAGTYNLIGTGNIMYGSINNMMIQISGPTAMQLQVASAVVSNASGLDRNSSSNRLGILSSFLVVNGQPCGAITTY